MNKKAWWKLEKFFQGGKTIVQVKMPFRYPTEHWMKALEYFGENTNGGKCYGYSVYKKKLKAKHKKLPVFNIPIENL